MPSDLIDYDLGPGAFFGYCFNYEGFGVSEVCPA